MWPVGCLLRILRKLPWYDKSALFCPVNLLWSPHWSCSSTDPSFVGLWSCWSLFSGHVISLIDLWWSCCSTVSSLVVLWICWSSCAVLQFLWSFSNGSVVLLILLWWSYAFGDPVVPMTLLWWSCGSTEPSWVILWFRWSFFWFHWASLCIDKHNVPSPSVAFQPSRCIWCHCLGKYQWSDKIMINAMKKWGL